MENNNISADLRRRRHGAEHADRIATIHFVEKKLLKILIGAIGIKGILAISNLKTIMCIYTMLLIVGQLLFLKMRRQDIDPRIRLTFARIAVVLGCVRCYLLTYVSLRVMLWPVFTLRILELMNP